MNFQSKQQLIQDQSKSDFFITSVESDIEFNKQFKLKKIEYFNSELNIENENIISDDKF